MWLNLGLSPHFNISKSGIILLYLLVAAIKSFAQNDAVIKGKIIDNDNKEPIAGALIVSQLHQKQTISNADGAFEWEINDLTPTALIISAEGYNTDTIVLDSQRTITILLSKSKSLNEVVVRSRKKSTEINLLGAVKTENIGSKELMKAACCNLSESFETTPSIDVGFTDAVSGYKQIQMLGLAGSYTSFTRENIPDIRGLAAITGLTFTPGTWVESMQLSKGAGSVVNGFEGTAGQINVEWKKPFVKDEPKVYLNGYQSTQGRTEGNAVVNLNLNEKVSTNVLLHGRSDWAQIDQNNDKFMDQPLGKSFVGANRWFYFDPSGFEVQGGIKAVFLKNNGGEINNEGAGSTWKYRQEVNRIEAWAKIGKVYAAQPWKSMGMQLSGIYHNQHSSYGVRHFQAKQNTFYGNYIYQTIIGNTNHIFKTGASLVADNISEQFVADYFARVELVPGAFAEYSYSYTTKLNVVAGLRSDYHNIFGAFVTPRLHLRYAPLENSVFRASMGRAQRTANIFAEQMGFMASNRNFTIEQQNAHLPYGLKPEIAWNAGVNFTQKFLLNYRDGAFSTDYYYTHFTNQVVVDIEKAGELRFYNLQGQSFAHSFQAQLDYEPIRKLDVRLAYRWYNVMNTYDGILKQKPLIAAHRAFANIAYETKNQWKFDYTIHWNGSKRLPNRFAHHGSAIQPESYSPSFIQMNAQISKAWKNGDVEIYSGMENITGIMQHDMILGAANPFGNTFDASLIWGPAMGRNVYFGFRYKIK